ncbi:MAG TPA: M3 family metallopeptidase [Minicystis sp.]|nr:M3 family metallopeptidase [Minicystis sp.]
MKRRLAAPFVLAVVATSGCAAETPPAAPPPPPPAPATAASAPPPAPANPFFERSALPYELPPFDKIKVTDFEPAYERGMAEHLDEVHAIANAAASPTFDNTIVALERAGQILNRVTLVFTNLNESNTDPAMERIESKVTPELSAHNDAVFLDAKLFSRVDALYQKRASLGLDPESLQVLERYENQFVRAGARLSDPDKAKLKEINTSLASLQTTFRQRVLEATKDGAVVVDDPKQLDGLSTEQIGAAAQAAKARGLEGKWVLTLQNTTIQPPLEQLKNRALRERIFKASVARAQGGPADTTAIVTKILHLRAQKAKLLGYPSFAAYALAEETAKTPQAVNAMQAEVAPAALAKAREEAAEIQRQIDKDARAAHQKTFKLEPWDWAYYAAEVRKAKYDFDVEQVKPYFELDRVLHDGVFYAAHELYGLTFTERKDLPVYHPDVRVFEVKDEHGGAIGLLLLDDFARDAKQGGAWMENYVNQDGLLDEKPVVVNNLNISKPAPGAPALLTFDEVTTMFHEFGHALHGLLSSCKYPLISGTSVPNDFVEFPSQFNEMWAREPAVVAHFAKHYKTGAPMPKALLDRVLAARDYGQGYATLEALEAAMLDQDLHQTPEADLPTPDKVIAFEQAALKKDHVAYEPVPPRYSTPYFGHIFQEGYEAGYYAYLWSEVLARDAGAWFHAHGGLSRAAGDVFRAKILSRGRTKEPNVLFQEFYGKAPEIQPLLAYHGLSLPRGPKKK